VEPQIRHSRLEEVLLTIYELPNLGDPREFLLKMPDPPEPLRVDTAITRLLELNALDRAAANTCGSKARPTHFGRFLQKMPLDPEVGCLVMHGVRLRCIDECAIIAAVHQRGGPFLDSQEWKPDEVKALHEVRDACSPGRAIGCKKPLPSDLVASMRAYQAWQAEGRNRQGSRQPWDYVVEAKWCHQHYLSLERLQEIEEMVLQIREVLEQLGYGEGVPAHMREQMRRRRQAKLNAQSSLLPNSVPLISRETNSPSDDLRRLLKPTESRDTLLLLAWCIAASFTAGIIEVRNGSSTDQVKLRPKKYREEEMVDALKNRGFAITHVQFHRYGERVVTFRNAEEAHRCMQQASLCNNWHVPWRTADIWGRPKHRKIEEPRKCYDGCPFRILPSSVAQPVPDDDVTLVAAEVLPCMDHKRTSMSYFGTKCTVVPRGILPLILCATYPAATKEIIPQQDGRSVWKVTAQIHGKVETMEFNAPPARVGGLLDDIRNKMDTEFGLPQQKRERIVSDRRNAVLELMRLLDESGPPPMPPLVDPATYLEGRTNVGGNRGRRCATDPMDSFGSAALNSFLRQLDSNDLRNFRL